ncbi:MAG: hypothetical protein ACM3NH_01825 [Candidatus Saccharibacteria bacterium]
MIGISKEWTTEERLELARVFCSFLVISSGVLEMKYCQTLSFILEMPSAFLEAHRKQIMDDVETVALKIKLLQR